MNLILVFNGMKYKLLNSTFLSVCCPQFACLQSVFCPLHNVVDIENIQNKVILTIIEIL